MKKFHLPRITWIIWIITAVVGIVLIAAYGHAFRKEYSIPLAKASSGDFKIRVHDDPGDINSSEGSFADAAADVSQADGALEEKASEIKDISDAAFDKMLGDASTQNDAAFDKMPGDVSDQTPVESDGTTGAGLEDLSGDASDQSATDEHESAPLVEEEPAAPPKYVALTFDDGPSEKATLRILDTLEEYGARATFFTVGYNISPFRDHLKREIEIGCEVANHTSNHPHLTKLSKDQIKKEINDNEALIRKICELPEDKVVLLRPPYGEYNQTVLDMLTMPAVCWSLDSLDWKSRNCDAIVQLVESKVEDGSVILMHDLYDSTAEAVDVLVPWFIENGYELVTVSELYEQKGEELRPGHVYAKADSKQR